MKSPQEQRPSWTIPIEEKENFCWVEGLRDLMELAPQMPQTRLIEVCDREADFFELFDEQRRNPAVDLLVRARYSRALQGEDGWDAPAMHPRVIS